MKRENMARAREIISKLQFLEQQTASLKSRSEWGTNTIVIENDLFNQGISINHINTNEIIRQQIQANDYEFSRLKQELEAL